MEKLNEFINNDELRKIFNGLDRKVFLETAHLSDFYEVLNNEHYKSILKNIDYFLPFIVEKILSNEYKFPHKLLIENIIDIDEKDFIKSVNKWWLKNKNKYGK